MTDYRWIADRLKRIDKTQKGLGEALGMDKSQVTRMLDGERRIQLDEVEAMARYLDISTVELLRRLGLRI